MKNEAEQTEMDILLASYFAGEADAAECVQVEAWMNASEENRNYFNASKKAWDASAALLSGKTFDTERAWKNLQLKINEPAEQKTRSNGGYRWYAAASVLLLIGIASLLWFTREEPQLPETLAMRSTTEIVNDTLSDGTIVNLNRGSELTYPSQFYGEERHVSLTGEAFFDVAHDTSHPFIIHTDKMDIKVLGTSFNVRAYPAGDSVHVSVQTGKVRCISNEDTVVITPGQYAVYKKGQGKIRVGEEDDPNRSAYRNRVFHFNDTPLSSLVQQLNAAYGCNIILKNQGLNSCRFSSTKVFNNEPVGNIIEAIKVTFPDITSDESGNMIILDGTGCK